MLQDPLNLLTTLGSSEANASVTVTIVEENFPHVLKCRAVLYLPHRSSNFLRVEQVCPTQDWFSGAGYWTEVRSELGSTATQADE